MSLLIPGAESLGSSFVRSSGGGALTGMTPGGGVTTGTGVAVCAACAASGSVCGASGCVAVSMASAAIGASLAMVRVFCQRKSESRKVEKCCLQTTEQSRPQEGKTTTEGAATLTLSLSQPATYNNGCRQDLLGWHRRACRFEPATLAASFHDANRRCARAMHVQPGNSA